jgi:AraC family transcriptional regulator
MKTVATGRVSFWEGGSLWVVNGPKASATSYRNAMHAHHALQLNFSLGGTFRFHLEDRIIPGPFSVIGPDTPHAIEGNGLVALLFIEPESRPGRTILKLLQGQPVAQITFEQARDAPALILDAFNDQRDASNALKQTGITICNRIGEHMRAAEPDRRVRHMLKWAHDNFDMPVAITAAAQGIGLSPSRASHLFVEETGLPFRTYVLWLRLTRAVDAHVSGMNLTEAAQDAGFADSAHLSRTFKRMFGLPAAALKMS